MRLKGARVLGPLERRVLRELFVLRERLAEESDQPPFRIMNNETLLELARRRPHVAQELSQVNGFTWKQVRRLGEDVLATIARAKELPPIKNFPELESRDGTGELDELQYELHERLKTLRKRWADQLDTDPAYVINRHVLLRLAKEQPQTWDALERLPGLVDWQLDDFGDELLDAIARFRADVQAGKVESKRRRPWRG
ncbi:MAG: HRDC domain-containing protein [Planctomycetes bacterium]|nr:HRDC domain-containing protein [Planctomycetota bacterium]